MDATQESIIPRLWTGYGLPWWNTSPMRPSAHQLSTELGLSMSHTGALRDGQAARPDLVFTGTCPPSLGGSTVHEEMRCIGSGPKTSYLAVGERAGSKLDRSMLWACGYRRPSL